MLQNPTVTDDEFDSVAAMKLNGYYDIDGLANNRRYERLNDVECLLLGSLNDENTAFLDKPGSLSYRVLKPAIANYCTSIKPKNREYLFSRIERNPALIDECLALYGVDTGLSAACRSRNLAFALERAENHQDPRILLVLLALPRTPAEYKESALANPRLEYCKEAISKAVGAVPPTEGKGT